ncbi:MAG TPA: xanthine dehydrogenase family protein molybdopterin-binding subunit [Chloroflexota bacterium]|nr:xanthine dehydrogenase family protein molybdopterin-binding subunit [Chloroflexota bacterium]
MATFVSIGKPLGRVEGEAKVMGAARYAADVNLPGMLWAKALRSPLPHARIVAIDTRRARALPGVRAIITAADIPDRLWGRALFDMQVLARDRVRFVGEKVAAVAADDPDTAEEALGLIEVQYEELPAVFDPVAAARPDAPVLHPDLLTYRGLPKLPFAEVPADVNNCHSHVFYRKGDVAEGFRQAVRVFEHTFTTPMGHHGYIEPHASVLRIDADGSVDVWQSNKMPFAAREHLSELIAVPEERITVHQCPVGGDFGGKGSLMDLPLCYHLARLTGRPVKMVMTYVEELQAANPRHPSVINLRTGLTADHRICARQATLYFNSGAYGGFKPVPWANVSGASEAGGVYNIPHVRIDAYSMYTNQVPCGHMRSPGDPQVAFAVESDLDMIAHALGMDPYEFRMLNALEEGDLSPTGQHWEHIKLKELLAATAEAISWGTPKPAPNVGRGMACCQRHIGGGSSESVVRVESDGSVTLLTGVPDVGTGAHTVLRQIVAETLTLPVAQVRVDVGDTSQAPPDVGSGASRVTHVAGQATYQATQQVRDELQARAARALGVATGAVRLENGAFVVVDDGGRGLPWSEVAASGPVERRASYSRRDVHQTCFAAQAAEVEVDRETGQVRVRRLVSGHDVGTIINPLGHQGQIDGGAVMGLGFGLLEEVGLEDGRVTTASLGEFKIPSVADIPPLTTVLLETPIGPSPYEAKAIGESANVPTAGAIANAVYDAVGVRITDLPITAEKVLRALRQ